MDKITLDRINTIIKDKYGKTLDGRARFRLHWSTHDLEYRRGDFGQVSSGGIITTYEENVVKQVKKYNYCQDRWVLEELTHVEVRPKDLISLESMSYEPVYVFWTGENGDYQEPTLEMIERRIHFKLTHTLRGHAPSEKRIREDQRKVSERNRAFLREKIDNAIPDLPHAIVHGSAVFMDSRKRME